MSQVGALFGAAFFELVRYKLTGSLRRRVGRDLDELTQRLAEDEEEAVARGADRAEARADRYGNYRDHFRAKPPPARSQTDLVGPSLECYPSTRVDDAHRRYAAPSEEDIAAAAEQSEDGWSAGVAAQPEPSPEAAWEEPEPAPAPRRRKRDVVKGWFRGTPPAPTEEEAAPRRRKRDVVKGWFRGTPTAPVEEASPLRPVDEEAPLETGGDNPGWAEGL